MSFWWDLNFILINFRLKVDDKCFSSFRGKNSSVLLVSLIMLKRCLISLRKSKYGCCYEEEDFGFDEWDCGVYEEVVIVKVGSGCFVCEG